MEWDNPQAEVSTIGHSTIERAQGAQDLWTKKKAEKGCSTETISRIVLLA